MHVPRSLTNAVLGFLLTMPAVSLAGQGAAPRAKQAYARAIELEAQGNHPGALALLWEAAGLAPRDADIQNRLGEALDRMGALDAAIDAFRQALRERPAFRTASNNLILTLVKAGKADEAVTRARALVAAAPDDPDSYFTLGLAQSDHDVGEAITSFRRVLALDPRHTRARYNLALVLRHADRLPDALEELDRAIAIEPRPEAYYMRGIIHWQLGDLHRAEEGLRRAIAIEPGFADAHATLGAVLKGKRDWTGAAEALRRAIALRPELPAPHYTLGQVLQLAGNESGARTELAEAERLRQQAALEQEASVTTVVGTGKLEAGETAAALALFRRAIAVFDGYAPAHFQMGRALQRLGQADAARAAFARAAELNANLVSPRDMRDPM